MRNNNTNFFYSDLIIHKTPLTELLEDRNNFSKVPDNWHIVLTDIKNSTQAVQNGQHETVNLIATGSIIAVINLARKENIEVPFFFGGDGATMIIPPNILQPVLRSLKEHQQNALRDFGMELRIGSLSVNHIYKKDHRLFISKLQLDPSFCIPIIFGKGLVYAEKLIKSEDPDFFNEEEKEPELDLTGMECRWNKIQPPKLTKEVVCLLVVIRNENEDLNIYRKVIDILEKIYGNKRERNPISIQGLKLNASINKIKTEMRVKFGKMDRSYLLTIILKTFLAKLFFWRNTKSGQYYFKRLVELSDTLVLDGRINTVIAGTSQQRERLTNRLDEMEKTGEILYGLHVNKESIISCYVRDRLDQHIHFVDGSDGGYTFAAKQLKKKLKMEDL